MSSFFSALSSAVVFFAKHWDPFLTALSFVLAVFSLYLHYRSFRRESIAVSVYQDDQADAFLVPLPNSSHKNLVFFRIVAENKSVHPVQLHSFTLCCPGRVSLSAHVNQPSGKHFRLFDAHNQTAREYDFRNDSFDTRISIGPRSAMRGWLTFSGVPESFKAGCSYKLAFRAGSKKCSIHVHVNDLEDGLHAAHVAPASRLNSAN